MKVYLLLMLQLFLCVVYCSTNSIYKQIELMINNPKECTEDDIKYIDNEVVIMYWMWTNHFLRYLKIKLYIYEHSDIYKNIKDSITDSGELFKDSFIIYNDKKEFIKNASNILFNEKSLNKIIETYISLPKGINFFQDLPLQELIRIFKIEKDNLIKSYKKLGMFEEFRDVLNSKNKNYNMLLENIGTHNTDIWFHDNIDSTVNNSANQNALNKVIAFNEMDIPIITPLNDNYCDKNKYNDLI
ncbi:conserved protein, unknown function [Hepatocystis sp. ex Piliocolobus tephrosceles]|nr:conserved protein, unknown function [Hepatocystis sp. ex Piliocolobus tephrosceles]